MTHLGHCACGRALASARDSRLVSCPYCVFERRTGRCATCRGVVSLNGVCATCHAPKPIVAVAHRKAVLRHGEVSR